MKVSGINRIGVIGAGIMGHGIAQIFAASDYQVHLVDLDRTILDKALEKIEWSLGKLATKGAITRERMERALASIVPFTSLGEALEDVDFAIETVTEDMAIKHGVYAEACNYLREDVILATNTSDLRITALATAVPNPSRFVGMHFLNPPPLMPLVAIVMGEKTSPETAETTLALAKSLGKMPILLRKDRDLTDIFGWILYESLWQLEDGACSQEEMDAAFRAEGFPMGMIELVDFTGLDTVKRVMSAKGQAIPPTLERKVGEGQLGMKTGRGFYDWSGGRPNIPLEKKGRFDVIRSMAPAVNEAVQFLEEEVSTAEEIDRAFELGQSFPYGPFRFADMRGIDAVIEALRSSPRGYEPHRRLLEMTQTGRLGKKSGGGFYDWSS